MSDLFYTRNRGSVIKIIRDDLSSESLMGVADIYFSEGQLPKIGNALTIFYTESLGEDDLPFGTDEFPFSNKMIDKKTLVVLEVSEILNANTVRAIFLKPAEEFREKIIREIIKGLTLGIEVIDSEKSMSDYAEEYSQEISKGLKVSNEILNIYFVNSIETLRSDQVELFNIRLRLGLLRKKAIQLGICKASRFRFTADQGKKKV